VSRIEETRSLKWAINAFLGYPTKGRRVAGTNSLTERKMSEACWELGWVEKSD
jgi:hypothetical protein